jgi:colanic acid/amylovoran biosynthesis glycosyltransferase
MEGMASGLPVVASRLSGIPELVDDARSGFLVPPGDALALADALQRLSDNPRLRHQMGQAGRDKVTREFNLMTNVEKRAWLYENQIVI